MIAAKIGDTVLVHYTGRLDDGTQFDSSRGREPIEFTIGQHDVIPGFENAVIGMKAGESKTQRIPAESAYGLYREDRVLRVARGEFPAELELAPGTRLRMILEAAGAEIPVTVVRVTDDEVTLDANHPLVGKDLTFEITLVSIVS